MRVRGCVVSLPSLGGPTPVAIALLAPSSSQLYHVQRRPCNSQTKGLETIAILSQDNFAIAYTDGSSDRSLSNGGAGIILLLPDAAQQKENPVSCNGYPHMSTLRVMNVQIALAKEARDIEHKCTTITLDDANAVVNIEL
ncbi:hypothetical protein TNCV_1936011 [Trichonephila clavipes]|nr:hypothetical protein TNCV_1936011 [Trichonephila clavipes]